MPVPERDEVRNRLLNLFPKDAVHESPHVDEQKKKADAIEDVVDNVGDHELCDFVATNFGRLHQYVYLFEWNPPEDDLEPDQFFSEEPIQTTQQEDEIHHYYLLDHIYSLVTESSNRDPSIQREQLRFSRPVKVVIADDHLRVNFTTMQKSPSAYVDEDCNVITSSPHPKTKTLLEANFLSTTGIVGHVHRMDINRGIKELWDRDDIDAPRVKYKRAVATSKDMMDEDLTVKEDDPDLYDELQDKPLFNTTFLLVGDNSCTKYFVADPTKGTIIFRRYSSTRDCIDNVVREIVEAN